MELRNDLDLLNKVLYDEGGEWDWNGPLPGALGRVIAWVETIPKDRLSSWHTVTVHSTGWHMAHPITCDLKNCAFDGLAQAEWVEPPTAEGIWQWHDFDDEPWIWVLDNADSEGS